MSEASDAVSSHDWVLGVTYSVMASIIGGASKLSIRKSWLIVADLKQQAHLASVNEAFAIEGQYVHDRTGDEREYAAPSNYDSLSRQSSSSGEDTNDRKMAPLEVSPTSPSYDRSNRHQWQTNRRDSLSVNGDDDGSNYFNPTRDSSGNKSVQQPQNTAKSSKRMQIVSWSLYLSGMVGMTFLNPLCCVLAMQYATPSILAPFSGLTLVWVVLFSRCFVGEIPGMSQKVACALIVWGQVLVAVFGDHTNGSEMTVDDVVSSWKTILYNTLCWS